MEKKSQLFTIFSVLSSGFLLISNLIAVKIWSFCGLPFDAGVILFPLTYILSDLVIELFGKKSSKWIIWVSFSLNFVAILIFLLAIELPAYPGWDGQTAFVKIFGFTPRVVCASLLAYILSSYTNIVVFDKIRESQQGEGKFYARALGSSVVAHLIDSAIFEFVAFFGILSPKEFFIQFLAAYAAGMILETVLYPLTAFLRGVFKRKFFMPKKIKR